ncbi:MAG: amidohydrolase family protein [Rhodospirillaceae bacterium]|nr:amidohydrolase family protein [Rhodospirillaceae bacterium]
MAGVLFTDVRVIDGVETEAFAGEVLVEGERIAAVARAPDRLPRDGAEVVEGGGRTLMPGLVEAHAHLSFHGARDLFEFVRMPVEEHLLVTLENAKVLLDHGFTSCFSAAAAKPRLDVVVRDAVAAGRFPGPRLLAATQEMTPSGNLGDLDTLYFSVPPQARFAVPCDSPDAWRAACRQAAREGVDTFKVNVSGDRGFEGWGAGTAATVMSDGELAVVVQEAAARGKRVAAHATSAGAVKMCVRHGVPVVYHAALLDEEAMDMLEAARDRVFVAPTIGFPYALVHEARDYGVAFDAATQRRNEGELDSIVRGMSALHRRGLRVLPGGDYGLFCTPQGRNARDLELFVRLLGFTPAEAIAAATRHGGALMGRPEELGQVRPGFVADLLLVDGDPLADIAVLQDATRLAGIMKGGVFHRRPAAVRQSQRRAAE